MSSFVKMVIYFSNEPFLRCMEHAIHVDAGHFIQVVSPTSVCILVKRIKKAFHDAQLDNDNIDFDALEADLGGDDDNDNADDANNEADDNDEDADDKAADFTVGDTIGKSLALVKQVSTVQYM